MDTGWQPICTRFSVGPIFVSVEDILTTDGGDEFTGYADLMPISGPHL